MPWNSYWLFWYSVRYIITSLLKFRITEFSERKEDALSISCREFRGAQHSMVGCKRFFIEECTNLLIVMRLLGDITGKCLWDFWGTTRFPFKHFKPYANKIPLKEGRALISSLIKWLEFTSYAFPPSFITILQKVDFR